MNHTSPDLRDGESSDEASFEYLIEVARRLLDEDSQKHFDELKERLKALKDAEAAVGELESVRLQMTMERMSQLESILASLLAKLEETRCAILDNLK